MMEMKKKIEKLQDIRRSRGINAAAKKVYEQIKREVFSRFYLDGGGIDDAVLIAGSGRSGTTWLASMLSKKYNYRLIFEPFWNLHYEVKGQEDFFHHRYIPPGSGEEYSSYINEVLSGEYRSEGTNSRNTHFFYKGRIIKTICANLFLPVIKKHFPSIPIVFIVRDPASVTVSRLQKKEFAKPWGKHAHLFKRQDNLISRLKKHGVGHIEVNNELEDHATTWCFENFLPLNEWDNNNYFLVVYYENLVLNTDQVLNKIFDYISDESYIKGYSRDKTLKSEVLMTDPTRAKEIRENPKKHLLRYREELSEEQLGRIKDIVDHFKLSHVPKRIRSFIEG